MASLDELLHEVRRIEEHRVTLTEKKIKSIYQSLMKDLNGFISDEYIKYADKDGKLFLSYLDSKNKRAKFLYEIAKNVDGISPQVKKEMLDLVDKTYEKAYKGMADAVKNADDTKELLSSTDTLVRPEVLKQAVENNIDKLTLDAVMEKHRAEIIADIQQTIGVGLMNGDRYETMAKRIQERLGVSYSKASNIARTESHRNIESGLLDGAKETAKIIEEDGDLIYAATWRTMKDDRVRPQQMRKTKRGWVKTISKNGADHVKMEGVTIKVGEKFKLEPSVYAECPSMSGTARNDCRCRCFLQYNLMTVAEFAKATGQTEEAVRKKYSMPVKEKDLTNEEKPAKIENDELHPVEIAGVKRGKPMTFEEANELRANPNFKQGGGYRINCQSCVVTNEARRRGYNVETLPNTSGSKLQELSRKTNLAWIDPKTGDHPEYIFDETIRTPKRFRKFLDEVIEAGNRYTLQFTWKGRGFGGHIICAERMESGALRLYDPQIGKSYIGDAILDYVSRFKYETTMYGTKYPTSPKILRVDDKSFFLDMVNHIMKGVD